MYEQEEAMPDVKSAEKKIAEAEKIAIENPGASIALSLAAIARLILQSIIEDGGGTVEEHAETDSPAEPEPAPVGASSGGGDEG